VFDFFKETDHDSGEAGGYTEKIKLSSIGQSHGAKKNML
jgi:hypothetical protein